MFNRKKGEESNLSVLDAVETLSSIAEIDFEREVEVATEEEIRAQNALVIARTIQRLKSPDQKHAIKLISEMFHTILDYLKNFYKHDYRQVNQPEVVEGVKTIMVLVGEAAQKLDRYTTLFHETKEHSVKQLKEYRQLQEFYLTRIARRIDEGVLGKWIWELTRGALEKKEKGKVKFQAKKAMHTQHVFIDMESVKRDSEYELFFLRKEDGSHFFNPRLIRNIKLVADFGDNLNEKEGKDPFDSIKLWQDRDAHQASKDILRAQGGTLDRFFHEAKGAWKREFVSDLYKAVVALMMCANSKNLLSNTPSKSCGEYFSDFQVFLRQALTSREYQRFLLDPPKKSSRLSHCLLDLAHRLCGALFTSVRGYQELFPEFKLLVEMAEKGQSEEHEKEAKSCHMIWSKLAADYAAMKKLCRLHSNGPLMKVLDLLEQGYYHVFDPIGQSNFPNRLFSLYLEEQRMTCIHMASPTVQEFIHKAKVLEEFKGFIRSYAQEQIKKHFLLIDLQDRTSWREHFRATCLEEVANQPMYAKALTVVTLPKDTEFYHQQSPYQGSNHADVFLNHFNENINEEGCGFYFPSKMKKVLFDEFIEGAMKAVHQFFFGGMNVLTLKNRLDFIEIFYLFLELKILECAKPDAFSLTCKDGIDVGGCASVGLFAFCKILYGRQPMNKEETMHLNLLLHMPALLIRGRVVLPEVWERTVNAIKRIEEVKKEMGEKAFLEGIYKNFGKYYRTSILNATALFSEIEGEGNTETYQAAA